MVNGSFNRKGDSFCTRLFINPYGCSLQSIRQSYLHIQSSVQADSTLEINGIIANINLHIVIMQKTVFEQSKGEFKLVQLVLGEDAPVVTVNEDKKEIILNKASRPLKKKKADMVIQSVEVAYFVAKQTAKTEKDRHDIFYELIKKILGELI